MNETLDDEGESLFTASTEQVEDRCGAKKFDTFESLPKLKAAVRKNATKWDFVRFSVNHTKCGE